MPRLHHVQKCVETLQGAWATYGLRPVREDLDLRLNLTVTTNDKSVSLSNFNQTYDMGMEFIDS